MTWIAYIIIRILTFPLTFLSYKAIHALGSFLGAIAYYSLAKFRKKALSNLALATTLDLKEPEIISYAKMSIQNLMITCLEYAKFAKEKDIGVIASCKNPSLAKELIQKKIGVIFFCAHQSNWEILFLEGTYRMPGVAIGRPIKNRFLYHWILSIRERFGGKIITPQNAIKEGLRALKQGKFLGIVGDQGMPDSGFSSLFFGRKAWTSPMPAILAHRTGNPIIVATTKRINNRYEITYSDPIWPEKNTPLELEIPRLMEKSLSLLENAIKESPGEWLWSHNRWKQQLPGRLKKLFRQDAIAIILPEDCINFKTVYDELPTFAQIYPSECVVLMLPETYKSYDIPNRFETIYYKKKEELFIRDFRFKLVFNFTGIKKLHSHFLGLSAFNVFSTKDLCKIGKTTPQTPLFETLEKAVYAN